NNKRMQNPTQTIKFLSMIFSKCLAIIPKIRNASPHKVGHAI
ncbi:hypothetical protein HMPREF1443_00367, partial [Helicobacter pylori HP250BFi]